ncbi:multicopy suppressor of ts gsp1 [Orbilia blumenaviensis]|uniref:Multicopy suppressor of ts gsp1 n=1 Tax=Orbilia blumenaviensis TaxID=1796055 RepID=A0AAV9VPW5_9PEZI
MQNISFTEKELFGGAITANVPSTWTDLSNIRQVPDNQECFIDITGLATLIFELNERVEKENDEEAIIFHLSDIFEDSPYKIWKSWKLETAEAPQLDGIPAYAMVLTTPYVENRRDKVGHESQFVALAVVIVRLEKQKTDIVITANMPHSFEEATAETTLCRPGYEGQKGIPEDYVWSPENAAQPLKNLLDIIEQGVKTFNIRDFGLFVNEED